MLFTQDCNAEDDAQQLYRILGMFFKNCCHIWKGVRVSMYRDTDLNLVLCGVSESLLAVLPACLV